MTTKKPTARDIMTSGVEFAGLDQSVSAAAKCMADKNIGAMPVCGPDKRLQGMLTDRDIVVKVIAAGKDPTSTHVSECCTPGEVVTCGADDLAEEALKTMKEHKLRRLPVIDGTDVVGIISQGDLAVNLSDTKAGGLLTAISSAP